MCDIEFDEVEALSDAELPVATGGVQAAHEQYGNEDRVDGCDVDFTAPDATADEDLPLAVGGVVEVVP